MSKQNEQVIKRDEYKVGMTVRLRNESDVVVTERYSETASCDDGRARWADDGLCCRGDESGCDIIGEVVANAPTTKVATRVKAYDTKIEVTYDDGTVITEGQIEGMDIEDVREMMLDHRRGLERYKVQAAIHGWEV
jgi:hypothetical protein